MYTNGIHVAQADNGKTDLNAIKMTAFVYCTTKHTLTHMYPHKRMLFVFALLSIFAFALPVYLQFVDTKTEEWK